MVFEDCQIPNSKGCRNNRTSSPKRHLLSNGHIKEAIKKGSALEMIAARKDMVMSKLPDDLLQFEVDRSDESNAQKSKKEPGELYRRRSLKSSYKHFVLRVKMEPNASDI